MRVASASASASNPPQRALYCRLIVRYAMSCCACMCVDKSTRHYMKDEGLTHTAPAMRSASKTGTHLCSPRFTRRGDVCSQHADGAPTDSTGLPPRPTRVRM
eukprot:scaffold27601_cov130-Isochrysis_galbana.AAC.2